MFLKSPPPDYVPESQLLNETSKANDDNGTRKGKKGRKHKEKLERSASPDDSTNWLTESEESSDECPSSRRRRKRLRTDDDEMKLAIMWHIFEVQSKDVKSVINYLYQLHRRRQRRAAIRRRFNRPLLITNKPSNGLKKGGGAVTVGNTTTNVGFSSNVKILARLQRRRRNRGKPRSKRNKHKKFPRRRRRANAKQGNRQGRKRYLRAQRLFDKGFFLVGRKLLDDVWQAVKDPNSTATSFCNNNTHGLSKIHKKQIELYERIEEDLQRLDVARHERAQAALERKAKEEKQKEATRDGVEFKNKIEAREAKRVEFNLLRNQRRAARKQRALDKKLRTENGKREQSCICNQSSEI